MKSKNLGFCVGLLTLSASSFGEAYQAEIAASYDQAKVDYGFGSADVDTIGLKGKIYFDAVESSGQPLAEDAYLAKTNNFSLLHNMIDGEGVETTVDLARIEFYVPDAKLYIAPFYVYMGSDYSGEDDSDSDNTYGASVGITPADGMRISTTWVDYLDYELNFDLKYVKELGNGTAVNFEFGYEMTDDDAARDNHFDLAFDYYFKPTCSIGMFYQNNIGLSDVFEYGKTIVGEDTVGLRGATYFSEAFSLYGSYAMSDDVDSFNIGLNYRL